MSIMIFATAVALSGQAVTVPPQAASASAPAAPGPTLDRFKRKQLGRLMAADKDGDKRVSMAEYTAVHTGPRAPRQFKRMDSDGDGFVSATEANDAATARFARMDKDGDGRLAKTERGGRNATTSSAAATAPADID